MYETNLQRTKGYIVENNEGNTESSNAKNKHISFVPILLGRVFLINPFIPNMKNRSKDYTSQYYVVTYCFNIIVFSFLVTLVRLHLR